MESKIIYKHDDNGNVIEKNGYNANGSLFNKDTYKYDEKGNVIEEDGYSVDSGFNYKNTYIYDSDEKGNWIKKIKKDKSNKYTEITERVIKYYK